VSARATGAAGSVADNPTRPARPTETGKGERQAGRRKDQGSFQQL